MNRSGEQLVAMIRAGEGVAVEFKECSTGLSRDVYETVCAFLNRHGGTILLGVTDSGQVAGIEAESVNRTKKAFVTAINNPQKLHPPAYLSVDEVVVEGRTVLHIYVPESSQVHRCNGRIYDRNEDGDLDITDQTVQVARLYQRKQATYSENTVYTHIQPADLRADLIERCRNHVRINHPGHPWAEMDDDALVKSGQLYQPHPEDRSFGVTLAGVMLLGTDNQILQVCPAHRTDLILRKVDVDRYDDRDLVRTNLIDSYDRIMAFIRKHLPDPFYLEGTERRSLRDAIFREVASNLLIHREYASGATTRCIIEYGRVVTDNPSRPHGFGRMDPATTVPFQKNPVIGAFFRQIDRADELGSGMRKMMKYGKKYGGTDPELIEGDIFRMVIRVPEFGEQKDDRNGLASGATVQKTAQKTSKKASVETSVETSVEASVETSVKTPEGIMAAMRDNPEYTLAEVAQIVGRTTRAVEMAVSKLTKAGKIRYVGPRKGGHWEVLDG